MRASLIVNPHASRVTPERIARVAAALQPIETLVSERAGHATELARAANGDRVWVLGGDGVVNEVVNGLRPGVSLGVVPAGHTNVFARALGSGPRRISLGRVNGRRFVFASGIGVDSETVRELETVQRLQAGRRPGDVAYAATVARLLLGGYEPRVDVEGLGRAAILFVCNDAVFTYAGPVAVRLAPSARFERGLDAVALERVTKRALARLVPRLAVGRGVAGVRGVLHGHDLDRLVVRCDEPLPLQADGEDLGDVTEAVFESERDAVEVVCAPLRRFHAAHG